MGLIADTLLATLQEQLDRHHVVVWFDPENAYPSLADALASQPLLKDTTFARYDPQQGFLALRRFLEPLWSQEQLPRLLIYVPLAESKTYNALAEYLVAGIRLEPGAHPPERNTRLAVIARRALEPVLPPAAVEKIISEVEKGQLHLAEIERLAERGQESLVGALSIIFESGSPEEIALRFLTDPSVDPKLSDKAAGPALASLLHETLDVNLGTGDNLASLRAGLARHLLTTEFLTSLAEEVPPSLKTIPLPASRAARQTSVQIVRQWRARRDLEASYVQACSKLEPELSLNNLPWSITALRNSETFLRPEGLLQSLVEKALVEKPTQDLWDLAEQREDGFWASYQPEAMLRWQVIADAAQVLLQAADLRHALKGELTAGALLKGYVGDSAQADTAWYHLDTVQRHLERDVHLFDYESQVHDTLFKLMAAAQMSYAEATDQLATRFLRAWEAANFNLPGVQQQTDIYHDFVQPATAAGPVAYIQVDALRFEMARELCAQLPEDWKAELIPALATPPTVTEVGMAALLPEAEKGLALVPAGTGKLGAAILGNVFKNRPERMKHLEKKGPAPVVVTELNQIAPLKDKNLRTSLKAARLIVVTASDEIDGLWENQPAMARQLQDHVFDQLRRAMRTLFNLGIGKVLITADHGYLNGDWLMTGEPLDPPGGETVDLHRRVWVGKGGAVAPGCMRKPLSAFGIGGDLELVTPYGLSVFKVPGGSTEYFHGGLSLQELVIPVLSVSAGKARATVETAAFRWSVSLGSPRITTRFFSATVKGEAMELFAVPPRLRVELRAGDKIISVPIAASYGFNETTRDVTMQFEAGAQGLLAANTITLQITDIPAVDAVSLYVLDELGASLQQVENIPLAITF